MGVEQHKTLCVELEMVIQLMYLGDDVISGGLYDNSVACRTRC